MAGPAPGAAAPPPLGILYIMILDVFGYVFGIFQNRISRTHNADILNRTIHHELMRRAHVLKHGLLSCDMEPVGAIFDFRCYEAVTSGRISNKIIFSSESASYSV